MRIDTAHYANEFPRHHTEISRSCIITSPFYHVTKDERLSWRGAVLVHEIAQDRATTLTTETLEMNWQWASRIVIEAMGVGAGNELRWAPVVH